MTHPAQALAWFSCWTLQSFYGRLTISFDSSCKSFLEGRNHYFILKRMLEKTKQPNNFLSPPPPPTLAKKIMVRPSYFLCANTCPAKISHHELHAANTFQDGGWLGKQVRKKTNRTRKEHNGLFKRVLYRCFNVIGLFFSSIRGKINVLDVFNTCFWNETLWNELSPAPIFITRDKPELISSCPFLWQAINSIFLELHFSVSY